MAASQEPRPTYADVMPGDLFEHVADCDYGEAVATVGPEAVTLTNGSRYEAEHYNGYWRAWPPAKGQ